MSRSLRLVAVAGAVMLAALGVSATPANAAAARRSCTAMDAPRALNPIPASNDCTPERRSGVSARAFTVLPVAPETTLSSTPIRFARTDGDLLAVTKIDGAPVPSLAIGGNFKNVITPSGLTVPASHFAILNELTGEVLFAGNASSYVRAITSFNGVTYVGGDFTTFNGVARNRAAAIATDGTVTPWNPSIGSRVRGMAADAGAVYLAGDFGALRKVNQTTGARIWQKATTGGASRAVLIQGGSVYLGGLFETYDGFTRHGLVKVDPSTGAVDPGFDSLLRADTGVGKYGAYDGEGVLALTTATSPDEIVLAIGGHAPPGLSSNELITVNGTTGARRWRVGLIGDGQAAATVGLTTVAGYHRNTANSTTPYPYFGAQFNSSTGKFAEWDPKLTGNQPNVSGGNNGIVAMYADPSIKTLFIAGGFTHWNGTRGYQSLAAFTWS